MRKRTTSTILLAALAIPASGQVLLSHQGQTPPGLEYFWGPAVIPARVFPTATPVDAWTMQNVGTVAPYPKYVYCSGVTSGAGPLDRGTAQFAWWTGWHLHSRLSVENSTFDPAHPSPYGNRGAAVVAVRLANLCFDIWFSNANGRLYIQTPTSTAPYAVGTPVLAPVLKDAPWFDLDLVWSNWNKRVSVFIDGQFVGDDPQGVDVLGYDNFQLGTTDGVSFGVSSKYARGSMTVADLSFFVRPTPVLWPNDSVVCLNGTRRIYFGGQTLGNATFTWYLNDLPVPGETKNYIDISASAITGPSRIRCAVRDDFGYSTTQNATISICRLDINCDQVIDLGDFFAFFSSFDQGDAGADLDSNGEVNLSDFFLFFNLWDTQTC